MKKEDVQTIEFGFKEKVLQFYFFHKTQVLTYSGAFLVASALCIVYFTMEPNEAEIAKTKTLYTEWKQHPADKNLQKEMKEAVKKVPGLQRGLEAQIAQTLINDGQIDSAESMAQSCIERLRKESPIHASFAQNSLTIEKKQFQKALEDSVRLKEELEKQKDSSSSLYACNLVRIAFLQAQVGNQPGELNAWEEVKSMLELQAGSQGAQFLRSNFGEKAFSLSDFISQREKALIH